VILPPLVFPGLSIGTWVYLRRNVIRSSAESGGGHAALDALLAHAEIGNLAVALSVQQDVVELQVSVEGVKVRLNH